MIFATVGTQLPFPRLVDALDRIAGRLSLEMVVQTCEQPQRRSNIVEHAVLDANTFERYAASAELIVGHAGIGTVLTARRNMKPVILFPRKADLGEHRNDHQLATVTALKDRPGIHIALNEEQLAALIIEPGLSALKPGDSPARDSLIQSLKAFIAAK